MIHQEEGLFGITAANITALGLIGPASSRHDVASAADPKTLKMAHFQM